MAARRRGYDVDRLVSKGAVTMDGKPPGTLWYPADGGARPFPVYAGCVWPTKGPTLAKFSATFFVATRGRFAGKPFVPRAHQREVLDGIFRLDELTGQRVVRTAAVEAPRKWGKSSVAGPVALWTLLMEEEDGAQEVYGAAGDRKQAGLVFREVRAMVMANEELAGRIKVYRDALEVTDGPTSGSVYRVLSSDAGGAQGLNPSLGIADECATWSGLGGGQDLWDALTQGTGARTAPLTLGISTPGWNTETFWGQLCAYGRRVTSGEVDDPTFYHRTWAPAAADADWQDERVWLECNPGLVGADAYLDIEDFRSAVKRTPEASWRRFRQCQWTSSYSAWIPASEWAACDKGAAADIADGEECVLVVDGSYNGDSTAAVLATADGRVGIARREDGTLAIWEKPAVADESWKVSQTEVADCIRDDLARRYRLPIVAFDPYRWQKTMEELEADGVPIVEYPMGNARRMVSAGNRFDSAIRDRALSHNGEPTLTRHLMNTGVKYDAVGPRPVKGMGRTNHIDAAICAVAAYELATTAMPAPPPAPVYRVLDPWAPEFQTAEEANDD